MKYIITQEQLQTVLNYLGSRPYVEVIKLIQILGQLQPAPADSDKKDEKIQTEISNKFTISKFSQLARASGWSVKKHWKDAKRYYAVFLLQA